MSAVYIGAGLDIRPLKLLRHINRFIFVDSKPRNEFGTNLTCSSFNTTFIEQLVDAMNLIGFVVESNKTFNNVKGIPNDSCCMSLIRKPKFSSPGLLVFSNGNRKIYYYYSTYFPYVEIDELNARLGYCDTIIFSKNDIHNRILELIKVPFTFVGLSGKSYYGSDRTGELINTSTFKNIQDDLTLVSNFLFFTTNNEHKWNNINLEYRRQLIQKY
jgi:hypothetical protein